MTGLESVAMAAAKTVTVQAATRWLTYRRGNRDRGSSLAELIQVSFRDTITQRKIEVQIEGIATDVAARLLKACTEYSDVDPNEVEAAIQLAVDIFMESGVTSDSGLFELDASTAKVAAELQSRAFSRMERAGLDEIGDSLCRIILDECAECYVEIVRALPNFTGRVGQETLIRLTRLSVDVAEVLARLPERRSADYSADHDANITGKYLRFVERYYDSLELFGVDVRSYTPQTALSIAYLSLSVTDESNDPFARASDLGAQKAGLRHHIQLTAEPDDYTGVRVEAALSRGSRILIRGEAGSGKSTLLRWLAVTAAKSSFTGDLQSWNGKIPLVVKLRSYANRPLPPITAILNDVANQMGTNIPTSWIERLFERDRVLLLVDGVDELVASQRTGVRKWLRSILSAHPGTVVAVTSRPTAASDRWLAAEEFSAVTFERMTPSDTAIFIQRWHKAIESSPHLPCDRRALPRYERRLISRLEGNHHIRGLATNPLMCAMLCALNLDRHDDLPHDRMSLYRAALEMLLERRDSVRLVPSYQAVALTARDAMSLLQDLGWRLALSNRSEMESHQAQDHVARKLSSLPQVTQGSDLVFHHLLDRSGVLREPAQDRVAFVHRTFQEYLTAKEIAEEDYIDALLERAHRDIWRETVIMTAGHANSRLRDRLIGGLLDRAGSKPRYARHLRLLAAACIETSPTMSPVILQRVDDSISKLIPPKTSTEARSLALAGDRILALLPDSLAGLQDSAAAAVVEAVSHVNGPAALAKLSSYCNDERSEVVRALIQAAPYFDPEEYGRRVLADSPLQMGMISVSAAMLPLVPHLNKLKSLEIISGSTPIAELLDKLPAVSSLALRDVDARDLSALQIQTQLQSLVITTEDDIDLSTFPRFAALRELELDTGSDGRITSIEALATIRSLVNLNLSDISDIADLSALGELEELTSLELYWGWSVTDASFLRRLRNLQNVSVNGLRDSRLLEKLVESGAPIRDLQVMKTDGLADLSPLLNFNLSSLDIDGCSEIRDLTPLTSQLELNYLDIRNLRNIESLDPLSKLRNLARLYLGNNGPLDLAPLPRGTALRVYYDNASNLVNADGLNTRSYNRMT